MRSCVLQQGSMCAMEGRERGRTLFEFSTEDVASCKCRDTGWDASYHTELDRLLLGGWEEAMKEGVFRYDLSEVACRTIPGQYGVVVMNNPKRFSHRRPPAVMQTLVQPFDHTQFNFNKINEREVLFEVSRKRGQDAGEVILWETTFPPTWSLCVFLCPHAERHVVAVNVSPIDRGHVLLLPDPSSCLPQVMTESSLKLCLELVSLSGHSGFCMVANSLLAYASVNHLHYHLMYTQHPHLPAKTVGGREVRGCRGCYQLTGHYVRGFGFQMNSDPKTCARAIYKVVSLLVESGVPHNIAMIRGPPFSDSSNSADHSNSDPTHANPEPSNSDPSNSDPSNSDPPHSSTPSFVRTILIPRKPVVGFKQLYQQKERGPPPFFAASCELALGLIPILDKEVYATITEEAIVARLREQELSEEEFSKLAQKLCNQPHE